MCITRAINAFNGSKVNMNSEVEGKQIILTNAVVKDTTYIERLEIPFSDALALTAEVTRNETKKHHYSSKALMCIMRRTHTNVRF